MVYTYIGLITVGQNNQHNVSMLNMKSLRVGVCIEIVPKSVSWFVSINISTKGGALNLRDLWSNIATMK